MLRFTLTGVLWLVCIACISTEVTKSIGGDKIKVQNKTIDVHTQNPIKSEKSLYLPSTSTVYQDQQHDNFTNLVRLADILDIFNIEDVAKVWSQHEHEFNKNCSKHMKEYFRGLQKASLWAVKSE